MEKAPTDHPKPCIGIVEDDGAYATALGEQLQHDGYAVRKWPSAEHYWRDRKRPVDLLLLDIGLPGMSGIELAGLLTLKAPEVRKMVLTTIQTDDVILEALRCGCSGYVLKTELEDIKESLEIVMNGGVIISPTVALKIVRTFERTADPTPGAILTAREAQVIEQIVAGNSAPRVAAALGISVHTVRNHLKKIYDKLAVSNRQELMRRASDLGFF